MPFCLFCHEVAHLLFLFQISSHSNFSSIRANCCVYQGWPFFIHSFVCFLLFCFFFMCLLSFCQITFETAMLFYGDIIFLLLTPTCLLSKCFLLKKCWLLVGCIGVLWPFDTFCVISGAVSYCPSTHFSSFQVQSVNLATLFLGKPPKQFTSTQCPFFHQ